MKHKKLNFFLIISFLLTMYLRAAPLNLGTFNDGDIISASQFNQAFRAIESLFNYTTAEDLAGTWNCTAYNNTDGSGWSSPEGTYTEITSQISFDEGLALSTESPNPFIPSDAYGFNGIQTSIPPNSNHLYFTHNNEVIEMKVSKLSAEVTEDTIRPARLTFERFSNSKAASFISCDPVEGQPTAPSNLSITQATKNYTDILDPFDVTLNFSWNFTPKEGEFIQGFHLYMAQGTDPVFRKIKTLGASDRSTNFNLTKRSKYTFRIKSYSSTSGESIGSNVEIYQSPLLLTFPQIAVKCSSHFGETTPLQNGNMTMNLYAESGTKTIASFTLNIQNNTFPHAEVPIASFKSTPEETIVLGTFPDGGLITLIMQEAIIDNAVFNVPQNFNFSCYPL